MQPSTLSREVAEAGGGGYLALALLMACILLGLPVLTIVGIGLADYRYRACHFRR
jgi:hypothetical protein